MVQPYTFTARENDTETGLYFYRARYYNARTGRFTTQDPIGFDGGDVNLYRYVGNNSLNWTDPTGLKTYMCQKPLDVFGGAGRKSGPEKDWNILFHQYICIQVNGKMICGGQTSSNLYIGLVGKSPIGSGYPSNDKFSPERCEEKKPDNKCMDKCLLTKMAQPRPFYTLLGPGTNCQEWADDVFSQCQNACKNK